MDYKEFAQNSAQELRELVLQSMQNHPDVRVYLFGSRATNTAGRYSDFDIALYSKKPLPHHIISELQDKAEESTIPYKIDFVDLNTTDEKFRQSALKGAILWKDWNND